MPYPEQQLGMHNLINRGTRKVGGGGKINKIRGGGGTENGPAILPIANSFDFFVWQALACQQHFSNSLKLSAISVLNNLTESQILNLL